MIEFNVAAKKWFARLKDNKKNELSLKYYNKTELSNSEIENMYLSEYINDANIDMKNIVIDDINEDDY